MTRQAFGYVRVSSDRQVKSGLSLEDQRHRIRAYCEAMGYQLVRVFSDEGVSGRTMKRRSGLVSALDAVCESSGVLVAIDLSRVARSRKDAETIVETLQGADGDLALIDLNVDTSTAMGRCTYAIIAAVCQLESDQASERTRRAMATAKARGVKLGPKFKLSEGQRISIRARRRRGERVKDLAKEYGVHPNTIGSICRSP